MRSAAVVERHTPPRTMLGMAVILGVRVMAVVRVSFRFYVMFLFGKTTELVHCAITGPCLHMRHRPSARRLYRFGRFTFYFAEVLHYCRYFIHSASIFRILQLCIIHVPSYPCYIN